MKIPLILASLLLAVSSASATVTLQFTTVLGSLQNFANASGVGGTSMVWGIIIDTAGNGFSYNAAVDTYASQGLTYTGGTLQALSLYGGGATDDVLFLAPNAMNLQPVTTDGMPAGTNRVTSIANVPFNGSSINAGDGFAVVWFDKTGAPNGSNIPFYSSFGAVNNAGFMIPADGSTVSFADLFTGADPLKTQSFHFDVPEPSTSLLGLLGAATLLRRRR